MRHALPAARLALVVSMIWASPATAQARDGLRVGFKAPTMPTAAPVMNSRAGRASRTYCKEGGFITGIPAAIAFNILYGDEDDASIFGRVLGTALVGLVFSVPGMVIEGLFPKQ